ncbi:hypothetical protein B0H13DRAFT_2111321 [Mycena leptocephala]|nr:hypothetical protein B0H13DRAFT_2111321 [Mycena leptocephala]
MDTLPIPSPGDPFKDHLLAVLCLHDGPSGAGGPVPRYSGPCDWRTDAILRKVEALMRSYNTARKDDAGTPEAGTGHYTDRSTDTSNNGSSSYSDSPEDEPNYTNTHHTADGMLGMPSLNPHTCPACGYRLLHSFDYAVSPGVVPAGGANTATQRDMDAREELRLLNDQVSDVSRVCKAIAAGDLTQKITVPVHGDLMVQLKTVINTMVDNLGHFATEVARVSREVGTEGKLGAQAHVENIEGIWRELIDEVNTLGANLTMQVRAIAAVTTAVARGDLSMQIEISAKGEILDLKTTVNAMVLRLRTLAVEVTRLTLEVGNQGKLGGQVDVLDAEGVWFELITNVNWMCLSITNQVRSIADVTTAVARGDLTKKIMTRAVGEMETLKSTVNGMVDQLSAFASEVTRVVLEVGTEGTLGGQAHVEGAQGTWKYLTDNVNKMAFNLTIQVRSISEVTRAVAYGDLNRSIDVDVSGEMLELKLTINEMVKRLGDFSREVTRLAAEVDMEDKLGDQAEVAGIQGTWKDLTDNVNNMIRRRKPVKPDSADEQTLEQTSTEEVLVPITTIASSRNPVIHLESLRGLYTAVLFGLPGHYLRDAPPQTLLGGETWTEASRTVHKRWMKEWTQMGTAAGVLFSVLFTVLQITSAAYDPAVRTVVQLSIVCLFFGVIYALILLTTFGKLQLDTNAPGVMPIIAENPSRETFWNLWVMLSMPIAWITW